MISNSNSDRYDREERVTSGFNSKTSGLHAL